MENSADLELKSLMNELTQGRELAELLRISLNTLSSSDESCEFLIQRIKNSYEKALSMLNNDDDLDREFKEYQNTTRKRSIFYHAMRIVMHNYELLHLNLNFCLAILQKGYEYVHEESSLMPRDRTGRTA